MNAFFRDRWVLITGASRGLGAEFARQLADLGAKLILSARTAEDLEAVCRLVRGQSGAECSVFVADLSLPGAAEQLFSEVRSSGLNVDILINNAGFGKWGRFELHDVQTYTRMVELNVNAVTALARLVLPEMLERGQGGILNVASNAAFQPVPYLSVYAATKAFVLNFSLSLWAEYRRRGIHVTALCPGATDTPFHEVAQARRDKLRGMMSPEPVVRKGLQALAKNRPFVVPGRANAIAARLVRWIPTRLLLSQTEKWMRAQAEPGVPQQK